MIEVVSGEAGGKEKEKEEVREKEKEKEEVREARD